MVVTGPRLKTIPWVFILLWNTMSSYQSFRQLRLARRTTSVAAWTTALPFGMRGQHRTVARLIEWKQPLVVSTAKSSELLRQMDSRWSYHRYIMRSLSSSISPVDASEKRYMQSHDENEIYKELRWISSELLRHDSLYYEGRPEIDDEAYDAMARREEAICKDYPHLEIKLQVESGLGKEATRRGRVGATVGPDAIEGETSGPNDGETRRDIESGESSEEQPLQPRLKRTHGLPMLSLDNVSNLEQLMAWLQRMFKRLGLDDVEDDTTISGVDVLEILTEPKLDGISLSLRYERQESQSTNRENEDSYHYSIKWASTRGDGRQGQDVTPAVVGGMPTLPKNLKLPWRQDPNGSHPPRSLEVRGEVVLPKSVFSKLVAEVPTSDPNETSTTSTPVFSNARNAASGILLRKSVDASAVVVHNLTTSKNRTGAETSDSSLPLQSFLRFYAYDLVWTDFDEGTMTVAEDAVQARRLLTQWGFDVPNPISLTELPVRVGGDDGKVYDGHGGSNNTAQRASLSWDQTDISKMLEYYNQLQRHRDEIQFGKKSAGRDISDKNSTASSLTFDNYDMDGCVHKLVNFHLRRRLGSSVKSPRWAVAHKFPPVTAMTYLKAIDVQVGRTGALTPVAILDPVDIAGVTVQRATLHNFGHLAHVLGERGERDKGVDESETLGTSQIPIGTPVFVRRAGDVIPQVVQRVETAEWNVATTTLTSASKEGTNSTAGFISLKPPTKCPACGSQVVMDEPSQSRESLGKVIRCGGPALNCPPRAVTYLSHAYSRDALEITGLSGARIQQLVDANFLQFPSDIFTWVDKDSKWDELAEMPGWGPKSALNLRNIARRVVTNGVSLDRFIYSLGIRQVGRHSSKLLASSFGNADAFLHELEFAANWTLNNDEAGNCASDDPDDDSQLAPEGRSSQPFASLVDGGVKGIGPVLLASLMEFSKDSVFVKAARDLGNALNVLDQPPTSDPGSLAIEKTNFIGGGDEETNLMPWEGLRVVFTGTLPNVTRSEATSIAKILGAQSIPKTVSKSTDILVYGDKGGKKLQEAAQLGIKTMDSDSFIKLIDRYGVKEN